MKLYWELAGWACVALSFFMPVEQSSFFIMTAWFCCIKGDLAELKAKIEG